MGHKRYLAYAVVAAILAALVYAQFRTWKDFDWATFWSQSEHIRLRNIVGAVALIYFSFYLRALRWKIILRPVRPETSTIALIPPTLIGFTGLTLLGRPGELIRPYLIARRTNLTFSSQMAAWTVERIFDVGAFSLLLGLAIFWPGTALHLLPPDIYHSVQIFGLLFLALAAGLSFGAVLVAKFGEAVSAAVERRFSRLGSNLGHRIAQRLREFHGGLDTIHSPVAFVQIVCVSLVMWSCIALAYLEVTHAYGTPLAHMTVSKVLLLTGSSMVGSLIQLPGVGGGSQLATISALQHIFDASHELAASCGILLWLATFVSVVPAGLLLAHRERLSLRKLSEETEQEEERVELSSSPPMA
jgi:glycosyltransferase 2 family protein